VKWFIACNPRFKSWHSRPDLILINLASEVIV